MGWEKTIWIAPAMLLTACGGPAAATGERQWTPVSFGGAGDDRQLFFVNKASIRRAAGDVVELETMMVRERPTAGGTDRAEERNRLFCGDRTALSLEARLYAGTRLLLRGEAEEKPTRFPDGSAWKILIDSVCDNDIPPQSTTDPAGYAERYFAR